jgi:hypothetical protein
MNAVASLARHFLTTLAGLGGFLFAHGLIPAEAVGLVDPLAVIAGLMAAAVVRLGIFFIGKIFPASAAKMTAAPAGMPWLVLWLVVGTAVVGILPSCSAAQLAAVPIRSCVETDYGTVCYSSKSGIAVTVDATSGK